MKKTALGLLLLFGCATQYCMAQGENNIWINNYPRFSLNFNTVPGPVFGDMPQEVPMWSGYVKTAGICSASGQLLFYTNGVSIYDNTGALMPNGSFPPPLTEFLYYRPTLVMPLPGSTTLYYVVTLDRNTGDSRLRYSVVDITLNGGKGDVVATQKDIPVRDKLMPNLLVAAPGEDCNIWISVHHESGKTWITYPLTVSGLGDPVYSEAGPDMPSPDNDNPAFINLMFGKFSSAKKQLAVGSGKFSLTGANSTYSSLEILQFNTANGSYTPGITLYHHIPGGYRPYIFPICFSPDDSKLYTVDIQDFEHRNFVWQYNLALPDPADILQSRQIVDTIPAPSAMFTGYITDMRLGPDGKIYIASETTVPLSRINEPNQAGTACSVQHNLTPDFTTFSSPVFFAEEAVVARMNAPADLLGNDTALCEGITLLLQTPPLDNVTYTWMNGATGNSLPVDKKGSYKVTAHTTCGSYSDSVRVDFYACQCSFIGAPSAFSPNGDGLNDIFLPLHNCGSNIRSYKLRLYNRWGQTVFSTTDAAKGWNGLIGSQPADAGVYFYTVDIVPQEVAFGTNLFRKGDVTLLR